MSGPKKEEDKKEVGASPRFSRSFLRTGLAIGLVYGLLLLLGIDRYACIIVMTSPSGSTPGALDTLLGGLFIVTYGLTTLVAPPMLIAAGLMAVVEWRWGGGLGGGGEDEIKD